MAVRYQIPGVDVTVTNRGEAVIWDGPHMVDDGGTEYHVTRSIIIDYGKAGISFVYGVSEQ